MKKTRDIILDTALNLFNTQGLSQVKLRTVANKMGISQGNLNYHFKKREDVIEALYFNLVDHISAHMKKPLEGDSVLAILFSNTKAVIYELFSYRFILLDFAQVMRENDRIRIHFQELQNQREKEFLAFFEVLRGAGLMREEQLPDEYKNLYIRFQMFGDFWVASAEISENSVTEKSIPKYLEIINQTIYPYLTAKGQREYHRVSMNYM